MELYVTTEDATTENESCEVSFIGARVARDAVLSLDLFPDLERRVVRAYGPGPGIMLHQLLYWYSRPRMSDRWRIYKTTKELQDERGIGRKVIEGARKVLKARGVLSEDRGLGGKLYYEIDWVLLAQTLNLESRMYPKGDNPECTPSRTLQNAPLGVRAHTVKNHSREPQEIPPGGAAAATEKDSNMEDQEPKSPETSTLLAESDNRKHEASRKLALNLSTSVGVDPKKYHRQFKKQLDDGATVEELEKASARIIERWSKIELPVRDALGDVRAGRDGQGTKNGKGTSEVALEVLRNYESPKTGSKHLRTLVGVAERWDFTREEKPPPSICREISPNYEEQSRLLKTLGSVCKRAVREADEAAADKGSRARAAMMSPLPTGKE